MSWPHVNKLARPEKHPTSWIYNTTNELARIENYEQDVIFGKKRKLVFTDIIENSIRNEVKNHHVYAKIALAILCI